MKRLVNLLAVIAVAYPILALEEPEPEVLLAPRNFNPHPYQAGYRTPTGNRGPVLFPQTPPVNGLGDGSLTNALDSHPYASVATRKKYKQAGRWRTQEDRVNPQVYKALAAHAAKVLLTPPSGLKDGYQDASLANQKKNYAFSYKVFDNLHGDDFSHSQSQDASATNGEYRVKLPDGRIQIVSYRADKNGYKADVKYTDDKGSETPVHQTQPQIEHPTPAKPQLHHQYVQAEEQYQDNYLQNEDIIYYQIPSRDYNAQYVKEATPIEEQGEYEVAVTPRPIYKTANAIQQPQVVYQPNYNTDDEQKYYHPVASTAAPDIQSYTPIYINPSKYTYYK